MSSRKSKASNQCCFRVEMASRITAEAVCRSRSETRSANCAQISITNCARPAVERLYPVMTFLVFGNSIKTVTRNVPEQLMNYSVNMFHA